MRYVEFRDAIEGELRRHAAGFTWKELRDRLELPYERACPTWVARLEQEIGLERAPGEGRAYVWTLPPASRAGGQPPASRGHGPEQEAAIGSRQEGSIRSALADELRVERLLREGRLSPEERVRLALALGLRDLRAFASANGLSMREARIQLRRTSQAGRGPSVASSHSAP